jgi:hypothetical protein
MELGKEIINGQNRTASASSFSMRCIGKPQRSRVPSTLLPAFAVAKRCSNTQSRGVSIPYCDSCIIK